MPENVLENERAALHRRQLDEDRQRRFHERRIDTGLVGLGALRHLGNELDVFSFVAFEKVHGSVVRDPKEPGF